MASLIGSSLPPMVEGQLRCFLSVKLGVLEWSIPAPPKDIRALLTWWGEKGNGTTLRPEVKNDPNYLASGKKVEAHFPIRCGPNQFAAYLEDMISLHFELVYGPSRIKFAKVDVIHIEDLTPSKPLIGVYPVICTNLEFKDKEIGNLHISVSFKSISDVHKTSATTTNKASVNTTDGQEVTKRKKKTAKKKVQSREICGNNKKHVKISRNSPDRITYNILSPIEKHGKEFVVGPGRSVVDVDNSTQPSESQLEKLSPQIVQTSLPLQLKYEGNADPVEISNVNHGTKELIKSSNGNDIQGEKQSNILSGLLSKGQQLRDAMLRSGIQSYQSRNQTGSGDLIKELLRDEGHLANDEINIIDLSEDKSSSSKNKNIESKAVELVLGEEDKIEHLLRRLNISDEDNEEVSDKNDPLHDSSLLSELFYTTTVNKIIDESSILFSDEEMQAPNELETRNSKPLNKGPQNSTEIHNQNTDCKEENSMEHSSFETSEEYSEASSADENLDMQDVYKKLLPEKISVEQLTALGRVKSVKFMLKHLFLKNINASVYFTELKFPVSTSNEPALELVRLVSRSISGETINFDRMSIFPICFDGKMVDYWWKNHVIVTLYTKFSQHQKPVIIAQGYLTLRKVLTSDVFATNFELQMYSVDEDQAISNNSKAIGTFQISVELVQDSARKMLVKGNQKSDNIMPRKLDKTLEIIRTQQMKKCKLPKRVITADSKGIHPLQTKNTVTITDNKQDYAIAGPKEKVENNMLHNIIVVEEGRDMFLHSVDDHRAGNFYFVCRVFWSSEDMKSKICWDTINPSFQYQQITPVTMTTQTINKMRNNLMIIEVWNKSTTTEKDKLIGMCKLSLHQYYLSYKDPMLASTILKSKYPVISHDSWIPVINLFSAKEHGHMNILFALGTHDQVMELLQVHKMKKQCSHSIKDIDRTVGDKHNSDSTEIHHQIEITLECVKGMMQDNEEVWGETDCYLQYNFPGQRNGNQRNGDTKLACFQSKTTLCTPNPVFNYSTSHSFILDQSSPLQRVLLEGFSHSPCSGEILFELWKRHYYPNVRDQLIAKAGLPLAKICAMITMHGNCDISTQSFHLPFSSVNTYQNPDHHVSTSLDVFIKYKANQNLDVTCEQPRNLVCLSVSILKLCGLKTAASFISKQVPNLRHNAEVGLNIYIKFYLSFLGDASYRSTRIVAKSFAPSFAYHTDFPLPVVKENRVVEDETCLASMLENGVLCCQIMHAYNRDGLDDVLIAEAKIPILEVLSHTTGLRGWQSLDLPKKYKNKNNLCAGGIEIEVKFPHNSDREHVINTGRGCGWCPITDVQLNDEAWLSRTELNNHDACYIQIVIGQLWLPQDVVEHLFPHHKQMKHPYKRVYARYKFYDKAPVCSHCSIMKAHGDEGHICILSHSKIYEVSPTTSFAWYLREEKLEVQFWFNCSTEVTNGFALPQSRDKLIGAAYLDTSLFSHSPYENHSVSGHYCLFKAGVDNICNVKARISVSFNEKCHADGAQVFNKEVNDLLDCPSEDFTSHDEHSLLSDICTQTNDYKDNKIEENQEAIDDDVGKLSIRFQVEEALHLPRFRKGDVYTEPDVYVSYQLENNSVIHTSIFHQSVKPRFKFHKVEKVSKDWLSNRHLEFKVWRCVSDIQNIESDILLGIANVDVSSLFIGMKQIIGWYNIQDFNRQVVGQIKVGVIPSMAISPSRSAKFFKQYELIQPINLDMTFFSKHVDPNLPAAETLSNTSKSMLFEQLRHNLDDLNEITTNIRKRLHSEPVPLRQEEITDVPIVTSVQPKHVNDRFDDPSSCSTERTDNFEPLSIPDHTDETGEIFSLIEVASNHNLDGGSRKGSIFSNESNATYDVTQDNCNAVIQGYGLSPSESVNEGEENIINDGEEEEIVMSDHHSHSTDELMEHLREFEKKYKYLKEIVRSDDDDFEYDSDLNQPVIIDKEKNRHDPIHYATKKNDHGVDVIMDEVVNVSSSDPSKEEIKVDVQLHTVADMEGEEISDEVLETKQRNNAQPLNEPATRPVAVEYRVESNIPKRHDDSSTLPNFFMRPQEMAASIKALRIAANFRHSPRSGSFSGNTSDCRSSDGDCATAIRRKPAAGAVNKALKERLRTKLPVEASEMARIASIFSSKEN